MRQANIATQFGCCNSKSDFLTSHSSCARISAQEILADNKELIMGVLKSCKPRKEVLQGDLDDAVFAADFGNLVAGKAPRVYGNVSMGALKPASDVRVKTSQ